MIEKYKNKTTTHTQKQKKSMQSPQPYFLTSLEYFVNLHSLGHLV